MMRTIFVTLVLATALPATARAEEKLELVLSGGYAAATFHRGVMFRGARAAMSLGGEAMPIMPTYFGANVFHGLTEGGLHLTHASAFVRAEIPYDRLRVAFGGEVGFILIPRVSSQRTADLASASVSATAGLSFDLIATDEFDLYLGANGSASYPYLFEASLGLGARWSL